MPSINDVIKHIKYISDLIGVDHVGLGSDYDGVEIMPIGLENVTKLPFLTKKLYFEIFFKSFSNFASANELLVMIIMKNNIKIFFIFCMFLQLVGK